MYYCCTPSPILFVMMTSDMPNWELTYINSTYKDFFSRALLQENPELNKYNVYSNAQASEPEGRGGIKGALASPNKKSFLCKVIHKHAHIFFGLTRFLIRSSRPPPSPHTSNLPPTSLKCLYWYCYLHSCTVNLNCT